MKDGFVFSPEEHRLVGRAVHALHRAVTDSDRVSSVWLVAIHATIKAYCADEHYRLNNERATFESMPPPSDEDF